MLTNATFRTLMTSHCTGWFMTGLLQSLYNCIGNIISYWLSQRTMNSKVYTCLFLLYQYVIPKTNIGFNLTFKKKQPNNHKVGQLPLMKGYNLTCRGPNPPFITPHPEPLSVLPPLAPPIAPNCSGLETAGGWDGHPADAWMKWRFFISQGIVGCTTNVPLWEIPI